MSTKSIISSLLCLFFVSQLYAGHEKGNATSVHHQESEVQSAPRHIEHTPALESSITVGDEANGVSTSEPIAEPAENDPVKLVEPGKIRKQVRDAAKSYRKAQRCGKNGNKALSIIFAILIPFVGVAIWDRGIRTNFWICLLFTLLFYLPGMLYALLYILVFGPLRDMPVH